MINAISTDRGFVSPHFGRCQTYTLVDIENGTVKTRKTINNPGHSPGVIPQFLFNQGVKRIICGGIGARARGYFQELGIEMITGIDGSVEDVIEQLTRNRKLDGGGYQCMPGDGRGYGIEKTECDHFNDGI